MYLTRTLILLTSLSEVNKRIFTVNAERTAGLKRSGVKMSSLGRFFCSERLREAAPFSQSRTLPSLHTTLYLPREYDPAAIYESSQARDLLRSYCGHVMWQERRTSNTPYFLHHPPIPGYRFVVGQWKFTGKEEMSVTKAAFSSSSYRYPVDIAIFSRT